MRRPRLLVLLVALTAAFPATAAAATDYVSYVNPLSGTLGSGFPMVGASVPFGLIQPGPDTGLPDGSEDEVNYCGYAFQDPSIRDFSLTHFDGAGIHIAGDVPFMPTTGDVSFDPSQNTSPYDHAQETAEPGYYAVTLARTGTQVELTSALRASMARITFPQTSRANLVFDPSRSIGGTDSGHTEVSADKTTLTGWTQSHDHYKVFFIAVFSRPATSVTAGPPGATALTFDASKDATVGMRTAISYVDADGAARNLAADAPPKRDFDAMRTRARAVWNRELGRVAATGAGPGATRTFYSNLYRFLLMPSVFDDADGRYLGLDQQIRTVAPGTHHYTALSLWDTYRTEFPLLSLVAPNVAHDVAISILDDADQNQGMLPRWVQANVDQQIMGGDSATATLGDAVGEGVLSDAEVQRAYAAMLRNGTSTSPVSSSREGLPDYMADGWVGQETTGRSGAALTLEYAIDDAAVLPAARQSGTAAEQAMWADRGRNWHNLWSPGDGFLRPRNSKKSGGAWASPNPLGVPGVWRPEFQDGWQEGTGYQYLWFVPQDVGGLAATMGGTDAAASRLDQFMAAPGPVQDKGSFFGAYYIGNQFTPANETDLWVPWYYDWLGQPWKTQRIVRKAMTSYSWRPDGMPGNDDAGTMAAWYVLAALGVYHAAPGSQAWEFSGPTLERAVINPDGGRKLTVVGAGASRVGRYVQSATFRGKSLDSTWLASDALRKGGVLSFEMGALPNRTWATGAGAAPPSLGD